MQNDENSVRNGSCLCGAVTYTVRGKMRPVIACHCSQCRKQSGHYYAASDAPDEALAVNGSDNITWYRSSPQAQRGFCTTCGSALFWKSDGHTHTSVLAGSLENPTGLNIEKHIFCADKGDYYTLDDGLPQFPQYK